MSTEGIEKKISPEFVEKMEELASHYIERAKREFYAQGILSKEDENEGLFFSSMQYSLALKSLEALRKAGRNLAESCAIAQTQAEKAIELSAVSLLRKGREENKQ